MKNTGSFILDLIRWIAVSILLGLVCGVVGSAFHHAVDIVTEIRTEHIWIMAFLPLGGIVICALYMLCKKQGDLSTNRVIEGAKGKVNVPFVMAPLIFVSTVITHFLGGSAGREGAALQLGGSFGYKTASVLRIKDEEKKFVVMAGMSAVFAALFGTPLTATFFSMEVMIVGSMCLKGIIPCIVSAYTASIVSDFLGCKAVKYTNILPVEMTTETLIASVVVAVACALAGMLFCTTIHKTEHLSDKYIPNKYIRAFLGGLIIILFSVILKTTDYNGAGMNIINNAISGQARYEAFILKIVFTAITIAAGFKGGEIVPSFFIGSTLGCALGLIFGFDPSFCASIGFVTLFCSVVNCPVASVFLAVEVFGGHNVAFYAIACAISFVVSGRYSLYSKQEFIGDVH